MKKKFTVALSLGAGLLGGVLSRYISPEKVHAQGLSPEKLAALGTPLKLPVVLLDPAGVPVGRMEIDHEGKPNIMLFDKPQSGGSRTTLYRVIWSAR